MGFSSDPRPDAPIIMAHIMETPELIEPPETPEKTETEIVADVEYTIANGASATTAWNSHLFHSKGTDAYDGFNHKSIGFIKKRPKVQTLQQKDNAREFYDHVTGGVAYFRGIDKVKGREIGPKDRAIDRVDTLRKGLVSCLQHSTFSGYVFAHDRVIISKEGKVIEGVKDFLTISPWQVLNTLTEVAGPKSQSQINKATRSLSLMKHIRSPNRPGWRDEWLETGQPVANWPSCSLYAPRCDESPELDDDKREVTMTIDLDGKWACSPEQLKTQDCDAVMKLFEGTHKDGSPARLTVISDVVTTAFRTVGLAVHVSWHKSIGWKPSWRGYVVGAIFKNLDQSKNFVETHILPALTSGEYPWFHFKLFDIASYSVGVDRCIGSAKLEPKNVNQMRFLDTSPLEAVSHKDLMAIFRKCPNQYLMMVLGFIYPYFNTWRNPHTLLVKGDFGAIVGAGNKKRKRVGGSSSGTKGGLSKEYGDRIESMVSKSLKAAGLAQDWTGSGAHRGKSLHGNRFVEINGTTDPDANHFCAHRECEKLYPHTQYDPPRLKKEIDRVPHTNSKKVSFRLYIDEDVRVKKKGVSPYWLKGNCYSCEKSFRMVCQVDANLMKGLIEMERAIERGDDGVKRVKGVKKTSVKALEAFNPQEDLDAMDYRIPQVTPVTQGTPETRETRETQEAREALEAENAMMDATVPIIDNISRFMTKLYFA